MVTSEAFLCGVVFTRPASPNDGSGALVELPERVEEPELSELVELPELVELLVLVELLGAGEPALGPSASARTWALTLAALRSWAWAG